MERDWSGNARRLSQADRSEIERLIWGGETFERAAAAVGCSTKSIQRFLALTGGLKRRVKERSALRLSLADREEISRGLTSGDSLRAIARRLRRAPSTVSRDVAWSGSRSRWRHLSPNRRPGTWTVIDHRRCCQRRICTNGRHAPRAGKKRQHHLSTTHGIRPWLVPPAFTSPTSTICLLSR